MAALHEWSLEDASREIKARRLSPVTLAQAILERIAQLDGTLQSYATVTAEQAIGQAQHAEREIADGKYRGPLHGIPVSVKDTIASAGIRTTASSRLFDAWVPEQDAGVITRLKSAGAVILGKAVCSELGFIGPMYARNPWNIRYFAGASSSGSAAGVAAGLAFGSIAGDSGGSIRDPAALCGVTGFKPTFGCVSRTRTVPLSHSFDTIGPIARSATDCALLFNAIAGYDSEDPVSVKTPPKVSHAELSRRLRGLRIGVPARFLDAGGMNEEVAKAFAFALDIMRDEGAKVTEIDIAYLRHARAVNWTILRAEGFNVHRSALLEQREKFSPSTYRALAVGEMLTAEDYLCAQQARTLIASEMAKTFETVDVIALPTRPVTAARGAFVAQPRAGDEAIANGDVNFLSLFNLTGGPAISLPAGFDSNGLPIGLQLAGRPYADSTVLSAARGFQEATDWHRKFPSVGEQR